MREVSGYKARLHALSTADSRRGPLRTDFVPGKTGMLIPPVSFSLVVGEVYRSGHPTELNFGFLDTLELKTVVYVGDSAPQDVSEEYKQWLKSRNIRLVELPMKPVKEPFQGDDPNKVAEALKEVIDEANHPILVHSDKGKHRVSVVVAAIRKCLQRWALAPIFEEYIRFAKGKVGSDFLFIEQFELTSIGVDQSRFPKWVHASRPTCDVLDKEAVAV